MWRQRLQKAERLHKVQEQLHRIAEWKLAELQRQITGLQEAQETLIQTLNNDDVLHGLFVESAARRLSNLAKDEERLRQAAKVQTRVVCDRAMQAKRIERFNEVLSVEGRRAAEKENYLQLLDALASAQASRKL